MLKIVVIIFLVLILNNSISLDAVLVENIENISSTDNLKLIRTNIINEFYTGKNVKIAIIDSGIYLEHPDFQNINISVYSIPNRAKNAIDECKHGTLVTSIVTQIAKDAEYLIIKYFKNRTCGGKFSYMAESINYAVEQNANIILITSGSNTYFKDVEDAIANAYEHNVLVIASGGNRKNDLPFYPAAYKYVIAVSGVDNGSNLYVNNSYGDFIDIAAPALNIQAAYYDFDNKHIGYGTFSGTSASAPHIAGMAALLLEAKPDLTVDELTEILLISAVDYGDFGYDQYYGFGRADAYLAFLYLQNKYDINYLYKNKNTSLLIPYFNK